MIVPQLDGSHADHNDLELSAKPGVEQDVDSQCPRQAPRNKKGQLSRVQQHVADLQNTFSPIAAMNPRMPPALRQFGRMSAFSRRRYRATSSTESGGKREEARVKECGKEFEIALSTLCQHVELSRVKERVTRGSILYK